MGDSKLGKLRRPLEDGTRVKKDTETLGKLFVKIKFKERRVQCDTPRKEKVNAEIQTGNDTSDAEGG